MFPKKIGQRIYVHKNLDSLHEMVPKEILTSDLGGPELPITVLHGNFFLLLIILYQPPWSTV